MMKNYLPLLFFLVILTATGKQVFAQDITNADIQKELEAVVTNNDTSNGNVTFTILAEVNITDAIVGEQNNRTLDIEFDLKNDGDPEREILYVAQLYKEVEVDGVSRGQTLVHEYVYPDVVDLDRGEVVHKQITYTVPNVFEGEYIVRILVANKSGFEYTGTTVGAYTFFGGALHDEAYLDPSTCALSVVGEDTLFSLTSGVDINAEKETLQIRCANTVFTKYELTKPRLVFRERSVFGDIVAEEVVKYGNVKVDGDSIVVDVHPPKKPQAYLVKLDFVRAAGTAISNPVTFRVVVQGESATVKNATLDRSSYVAGEQAVVRIIASGYADFFPNARANNAQEYQNTTNEQLYINVQIMSGTQACSDIQTVLSPIYKSGLFEVVVPITSNCEQPIPMITIANNSNEVLSELNPVEEKVIDPIETDSMFANAGKVAGGIAVILLLLVVGIFVARFRKKPEVPTALLLVVLFTLGVFGGTKEASATTFFVDLVDYGMLMTFDGWYQLNTTTIPCGGYVTGQAKMLISGCGNSAIGASIKIDNQLVGAYTHEAEDVGIGDFVNLGITDYVERTVGPKTTAGEGKVRFDFTVVDLIDPDVPLIANIVKFANFTVETCASFTANAMPVVGCAVEGDPTKTAKVDVSITGTSLTPAAENAYYFQCGYGAVWVNQTSNEYTCTFTTPGTKKIAYKYKTESGVTSSIKYKDVIVSNCNLDYDTTLEDYGCATEPASVRTAEMYLNIINVNNKVATYGFNCGGGEADWVYQTGNVYVCNFDTPGEKTVSYYVKDIYGTEVVKSGVVGTIDTCGSDFVLLSGDALTCAREGDDEKNAEVTMTVTSSDLPIEQYGFECDDQEWVYQAGSSYTCTFDGPGDKQLGYYIKDEKGNTAITYDYVTIEPCDITFSHSATVTGCATAGVPSEFATAELTISDPSIEPYLYGFKCEADDLWVETTESTHTCTFDAPGDYPVGFRVRGNDVGAVTDEGGIVRVYDCSCGTATGSLTINGETENVSVYEDTPFTLEWLFESPSPSYDCKLLTPEKSSLAPTIDVSKEGLISDTFTDPASNLIDAGSNPYTLSCVSLSCPTVNTDVNAVMVAPEITVTLSKSDPLVTTINVGTPIRWTVEASGGVPLEIGTYEVQWSGDVTSTYGLYTNDDGSPNDAVQFRDVMYSTLGEKTVTVTITDKWGIPKSQTKIIVIGDDRDPQ